MLIDTHCHLTYAGLAERLDEVLVRARSVGVERMILVAQDPADAYAAVDLIGLRPELFLVAGIHPHKAAQCSPQDFEALTALQRGEGPAAAVRERIVGVGETGLDFHYDFASPERQEEVFRAHLELAAELGRPVVIHARESEQRVCEILEEFPRLRGKVVFHCFSGDTGLARRALELACYLSFTGVVTFKNAKTIRESALNAPIDRIMIETDAPYLSPEPVRNVRPNEPALVVHTARFMAELRGEDYATFAAATTANAIRFFGLPEG